jgi:hypothetical protein
VSQPRFWRSSSCAWCSTPSAVTARPSAWPRSTIDATIGAHLQRRTVGQLVAPALGLPARLLDHPGADRHDQPGVLSEGNEVQRRDRALLRMIPAQQRLHGDDRAGWSGTPRAGRRAGTPRARAPAAAPTPSPCAASRGHASRRQRPRSGYRRVPWRPITSSSRLGCPATNCHSFLAFTLARVTPIPDFEYPAHQLDVLLRHRAPSVSRRDGIPTFHGAPHTGAQHRHRPARYWFRLAARTAMVVLGHAFLGRT